MTLFGHFIDDLSILIQNILQVNYLGHFLLTAKLLPVMKRSSSDCRILNMSSSVHSMGKFDMNTINYDGPPDKYGHVDYYGRSKLYQVGYTHIL